MLTTVSFALQVCSAAVGQLGTGDCIIQVWWAARFCTERVLWSMPCPAVCGFILSPTHAAQYCCGWLFCSHSVSTAPAHVARCWGCWVAKGKALFRRVVDDVGCGLLLPLVPDCRL